MVSSLPGELNTPLSIKWLMLCRAHTMNLEFQNWNELKRRCERLNGKMQFVFSFISKVSIRKDLSQQRIVYLLDALASRISSSKKNFLPDPAEGTPQERDQRNVIEKHEIDFGFKRPPRISLRLAFSGVYSPIIYIVVRATSRQASNTHCVTEFGYCASPLKDLRWKILRALQSRIGIECAASLPEIRSNFSVQSKLN